MPPSKWQHAIDYGIDVSILDANLRMTPTERVLAHQAALNLALALREAGQTFYAGLSKADRKTR